MASNVAKKHENSQYLSILSHSLSRIASQNLCSSCAFNEKDVIITKRNKKFRNGDFTIRIPNQNSNTQSSNLGTTWTQENMVSITNDDEVLISELKEEENGVYTVKLDRGAVFPIILRDALNANINFGRFTIRTDSSAVVNVEFLHLFEENICDEVSLSHLRSLLLAQHMQALLGFNGFRSENVRYRKTPKPYKEISDMFDFELDEWENSQAYKEVVDKLNYSLANSLYRKNIHGKQHRMSKSLGIDTVPVLTSDGLDLRKLINEKKLPDKSDGYDANIDVVDFSADMDRFKQLCVLEHNFHNIAPSSSEICVHVSSYDRLFNQQVVDLGWRALSNLKSDIQQVHVQSGPVELRKNCNVKNLPSAKDFIRLRRQQMQDSFEMKYGNQIQGDEWISIIEGLTKAAIRFEFLSTNSRSPLKLEFSEDNSGAVIDKGGVFVMYNCARLATLFKAFEEAVENKTYPPLRAMDEIDFGCLREEEEWGLLFNYILTFPSLVRSFVAPLEDNKPLSPFPTHKVCQFLLDLCRDFSSYYNRVHILGEPRQHLMETMHARLYLMKAVQQVMHNALGLLSIQPISQL